MAFHLKIKTFKVIAASVMIACLFFLSGVNFILYAQDHNATSLNKDIQHKETPECPIEEKAPDTKSFSSFQEYLPVQLLHISCFNKKAIHSIRKADQLHLVYYEIIAPPPKA